MSARKRYNEFHGHDIRFTESVPFHVPRSLVLLGTAVAIEYQCDKSNGGGDGTEAIYRHEFETPAYVCMDEKAKNQLYIIGKQIKITEAGIEN